MYVCSCLGLYVRACECVCVNETPIVIIVIIALLNNSFMLIMIMIYIIIKVIYIDFYANPNEIYLYVCKKYLFVNYTFSPHY